MSATPASLAIAFADGLEVALVFEDVGDLGDALDEHERAHLAERVVQRVQHRQEEHRRRGDARGDVAEHVDLRASRAARAELQHDRHAAGLQRGAHRAAHVDVRVAAVAARLHALRGQPPAQLRDDAVHGGEVGERARGQRAVELAERPRRRQVAGALDLRALELAAQQRLEAAQRVARQPVAARVVRRAGRAGARRAGRARGGCAARRRRSRPSPPGGARRPRSPSARGRASRPPSRRAARRRSARAARRAPRSDSSPSSARSSSRDALARRRPARRRGRRSARTRARRRAGPPGSWRASPRAPRGSPPARSS